MVCLGLTVVLTLALHGLNRELSPSHGYLSEYANGSWGWVLTLTLLLFAVGAWALAVGLRETTGQRMGPGMITAAGACMALGAFCSTDRYGDAEVVATLSGRLHGFTTIAAFALIVLAMAVLAQDLGRDERWGRLGRVTLPLALGAVLVAGLLFLAASDVAGLRQRAFLVPVFGWLVAVSLRLRSFESLERGPIPTARPG